MKATTRYSVGIDLGTTNSVLAYVDHEDANPVPKAFQIPQLVAAGELASLPSLPSFIYLSGNSPKESKLLSLPWRPEGNDYAVGVYARDLAATSPMKVVSSSKSWLCNDKIDRREPTLPPTAETEENPRAISPVDAARIILEHLRDAWNYEMASDNPENALEKQELVITVPASFDAVARDLTVEAANALGLHFTLLEEPQAAFYAWLSDNQETWRKQVGDGDVVLVCDIGGGTSDFSLIAVVDEDGDLTLQRLAVGDHTLLGGDNMDLTLAYTMSQKLKNEKHITLNTRQFLALSHACRKAKEALSSGNGKDHPITILGTGSGLVSGTIKTKITYDELREALLEGFFPKCAITDKPQDGRRSGMRSMSLEYASDPAFTKHLAAFLEKHSFKDENGVPLLPGMVLFNGGVTKSDLFRERIIETLNSWKDEESPDIQILNQSAGDLSVAIGAAWYAHVRQTGGIRIKAGSNRSYYIGVESPMPAVPGMVPPLDALCVVNFGMEEGTSAKIAEKGLGLIVGEPTSFRFFSSTGRQEDQIGDRIPYEEDAELTELPPLEVTLETENTNSTKHASLVPVRLRAELTEIGTLELWCDEAKGSESWKLVFSIRGNE